MSMSEHSATVDCTVLQWLVAEGISVTLINSQGLGLCISP